MIKFFNWFKKPVNKEEPGKAKIVNSIKLKTQRVFRRLSMLLNLYPKRLAGKADNKKCSEHLSSLLEPYVDEVEDQTFYAKPQSFRSWPIILIFFLALAILVLWYDFYILSSFFIFITMVIAFRAGYLSKGSFDFLFLRKKLINVIGKQDNKSDKTIILSSHYDAAIIPFLNKFNNRYIKLIIAFSIIMLPISFLLLFVMQNLITKIIISTFSLLSLSLLLLMGKKVSLGAGDNLISVSIMIEIARHFRENPANVNIIYAFFDAEESGCLGSYEYYKTNIISLSNTSCININLDSLYSYKELRVLETDVNGSIKLSNELVSEILDFSKSIGYEIKSDNMALFAGATDASNAIRFSIPAISIIGCDSGANKNHSVDDNIDNIEEEVVNGVLNLLIKYIENYSKE